MTQATILVVDDDEALRETLGVVVRRLGHRDLQVGDVAAAESVLMEEQVDLVISDLRMPGGSGLDLLDVVARVAPDTSIIMLTAYGTIETAVQAMQKGAFDYLLKPFDTNELGLRIERALEVRRCQIENDFLRGEIEERGSFEELIGVSEAWRRVVDLIQQVAPSKAPIVITGETGTGKELVAHAIHRRSPRAEQMLVPVNLAAVPLDLLESELFGHVRGAFTGAVSDRAGKFELAHGGTLFLDEIADAPLPLQPKILRVLQNGVIERLGSNQRRQVDARIISACNSDLETAVASGTLRADLYYRLNVVRISLPPLRERREDIPYLAAHFLRKFGGSRPGGIPKITEQALRLLQEYPWPGNVRELENVIERSMVLCRGDSLRARHLNLGTAGTPATDEAPAVRLDEALDRVEREIILHALEETDNVKSRAARLLGVSERSLWYKIRKHGLS